MLITLPARNDVRRNVGGARADVTAAMAAATEKLVELGICC